MPPLTLSVNGTDKVIAEMDRLVLLAKDLKPAFKVCRLLVLESVNRNFMAGGRPKWRSLSIETLERRAEKIAGFKEYRAGGNVSAAGERKFFGSNQVLRDTGLLMTSLGKPAEGGISEIKKDLMRVGTNVPYAHVHNEGLGVPKREFMILQPEDENKILNVFVDHFGKKE